MVATLGRRADGRHGRRAFIFSYVYFMNFCTMRFAHLFHGLFKLEDGGKEEAWRDWAGQQKEPHGESGRPYRQKGAWGCGVGHQELRGLPPGGLTVGAWVARKLSCSWRRGLGGQRPGVWTRQLQGPPLCGHTRALGTAGGWEHKPVLGEASAMPGMARVTASFHLPSPGQPL